MHKEGNAVQKTKTKPTNDSRHRWNLLFHVITETARLNFSRWTVLLSLQLFVFALDWFPFTQLCFIHCPPQQLFVRSHSP